jgi:hypothetical protein
VLSDITFGFVSLLGRRQPEENAFNLSCFVVKGDP